MREKWDEPRGTRTYGQLTIKTAIDDCTEVYEPGKRVMTKHIAEKKSSGIKEKPADAVQEAHVRLARLYRGRVDVIAWQQDIAAERKVNYGHFRGHLDGRELGIYPLMDNGKCAWASVMVVDDPVRALELQRLLEDSGLPALVLRMPGGGDEVTLFFEGWAEAAAVRSVLRHVVAEVGLPPSTPIFPEADHPKKPALGGFRAPPYRGAAKGSAGRVALDPATHQRVLSLEEFIAAAEARRISPDVVSGVAASLREEDPISQVAAGTLPLVTAKKQSRRSTEVHAVGPGCPIVSTDDLLSLHRRMLKARLPADAWPLVMELVTMTDVQTGWTLSPVPRLMKSLRLGRSTIFRLLNQLKSHGIIERVPLTRTGERWRRVALRLAGTLSARGVAWVGDSTTAQASDTPQNPQIDCGEIEESQQQDSVAENLRFGDDLRSTESHQRDLVTESQQRDSVGDSGDA